MKTEPRFVCVFNGESIAVDWVDGDGYFWKHGGYFPTLEECKVDIAEYYMGSAIVHEDTPCLDEPWWRTA